MAITQNTYTGDNSTVSYSITFQYLEETDIKVTLDGVVTTAYSLSNATTVTFDTAPGTGVAIRIYRDTNNDELAATFFAGSAIRAQDLNDDFLQSNYSVQEIKDRYVDAQAPVFQGDVNMGGYQFTNLGTPTDDGHVVTKNYIDSRLGDTTIPSHTRWRKTATASQTTFSGTGAYGGTLAYSATREQVYLNGALQQRDVDYTADDGTSVVFSVALTAGDVVDVVCVNNLTASTVADAGNINYGSQFTGQTIRTVANKLADVISVKDFGAAGDGLTDDTAAIQAALYAGGAATSKIVLVPYGTYKVTEPIHVPSSVVFTGEGRATTRLMYAGGATKKYSTKTRDGASISAILIVSNLRSDLVSGLGDITVRNLGFEIQAGSQVDDHIYIDGTTLLFENLYHRGDAEYPRDAFIRFSETVQMFDVTLRNLLMRSNVSTSSTYGDTSNLVNQTPIGIRAANCQTLRIQNCFIQNCQKNIRFLNTVDSTASVSAFIHNTRVESGYNANDPDYAGISIEDIGGEGYVNIDSCALELGPSNPSISSLAPHKGAISVRQGALVSITNNCFFASSSQVNGTYHEPYYVDIDPSSSGSVKEVHIFNNYFNGRYYPIRVRDDAAVLERNNHSDVVLRGMLDLVGTPAATLNGSTNDGVLTVNSATPQIVGSGKLRTANTSATTITNFLGGIEGMQFSLLIDDANTSITVGPTGNIRDLRLEAVITRLLPQYTLLNFHRIGGVWYTTIDPSLRGSYSWGGTVNAQSTTTISIPVTGAVSGRRAHVATSGSLNGVIMTNYVTTDTVVVTLANCTTSNISVPTTVFRALVTPL